MIPNWRWGHGHRAAKGLAERQAASKHSRWNPNPSSLVCLKRQPRCHPYETLCSLPSLTMALPADRTQRRVTAEELTTDRDKPHLNNGEQIKTYKTWEHTCFWSIISCQSHRLRWWRWRVVRDSPNSLFLTKLLRLYLFMRLASPCFPFPLSASLLGIGNSFTYVVFFYISFMRNSFRP